MSRARVAGFVVRWDADGETTPVLRTYAEAHVEVRRAEWATGGNVSGQIYAVSAEPYMPTRADLDAAHEAVRVARAGASS